MASYYLLNTVVLGGTVFPAGSAVDGNSDPLDRIRAAGGVLLNLPLSASLALGVDLAGKARARGGVVHGAEPDHAGRVGECPLRSRVAAAAYVYREGEPNPGGTYSPRSRGAWEAAVCGGAELDPGGPESGAAGGAAVGRRGERRPRRRHGPVVLLNVADGAVLGGLNSLSNLNLTSLSFVAGLRRPGQHVEPGPRPVRGCN
jgi:hypothetical protein